MHYFLKLFYSLFKRKAAAPIDAQKSTDETTASCTKQGGIIDGASTLNVKWKPQKQKAVARYIGRYRIPQRPSENTRYRSN